MTLDQTQQTELVDIWEGRKEPRSEFDVLGNASDTGKTRRRRKRKRRSGSSRKHRSFFARHKKGLIALAVLALLFGGAAFGVHSLLSTGKGNLQVGRGESDLDETLTYNGHTYQFNENVATIMVLGLDNPAAHEDVRAGSRLADANLLLAIDSATGKVNIVGFPRDADTEVDIYENGTYRLTATYQLAMAYATDTGSDAASALNSCRSASRLIHNLPINYYITIDQQTIEQLTTDVDGVMVEALDAPADGSYKVGDSVNLMGSDAWWYIRSRDTSEAQSAAKRLERQMQFSQAFANKMRHSDLPTLLRLFGSIRENVETNLGMSEVAFLGTSFLRAGNAEANLVKLEGATKLEEDADHIAREHVVLDEDSVMRAILEAYYIQLN